MSYNNKFADQRLLTRTKANRICAGQAERGQRIHLS